MKRTTTINRLVLLGALLALTVLPSPILATPENSPPRQSLGETLSLDAYWQRVQETGALVEGLRDEPPDVQRARLDAAAEQWAQVSAVLLPDGTHVPVDHAFLTARLRAAPPDLDSLGGLLDSLLAAQAGWPHAEWSAADLEALGQVLARPEFQWAPQEPSPLAQWLERAQQWFWENLGRLIPAGWSGAPLLRYGLTVLGIAALGAALFFALRGMFVGLVTEKELDAEAVDEENISAAAALKRAEALAGGGDYRSAVRYLYLSALLLLEENGLLRYDRSLTNREYLHSVAALPELAAALRRVVEVFERVWYGYEWLDEAAYRQYASWVVELRQLRHS